MPYKSYNFKIKSLNTKIFTLKNELKVEEIVNIVTNNFKVNKFVFFIDESVIKNINIIKIFKSNLTNDTINFKINTCIIITKTIKVDENIKNFDFANQIYSFLFDSGIDKNSFILAIGGGALSDLIGFVASTYKRGINFGFIPTTFLSMIDASFGGKNSINFKDIKNLIGTINLPSFIFILPTLIETLDEIQFISGFAEFTKYLIIDEDFYKKFIKSFSKFLQKKVDHKIFDNIPVNKLKEFFIQNPDFIIKAINIKYKFIKDDIFDSSKRQILNLGHTISHALELQFNLSHGIALYPSMLYEQKILDKILEIERKCKKTDKKLNKESIRKNNNKRILDKINHIYDIFKLPKSLKQAILLEKDGFSFEKYFETEKESQIHIISENKIKNKIKNKIEKNINNKIEEKVYKIDKIIEEIIEEIIEKLHQDKKNKDNFYRIIHFKSLKKINIINIDYKDFDSIFIDILKEELRINR